MSKIIDATLRFVDNFTKPMQDATEKFKYSSKQMVRVGDDISKIGDKIGKVGSSLTKSITLPLIGVGIGATKLAMDFEESLQKTETVFGKNSEAIKQWSETTLTRFGVAKNTALEMANLFGDMGTGMGQTEDQASQMSQNLVAMSADLASFKNANVEDVSQALKGIYTGETESLKNLGIVMNETLLKNFAKSKGYQGDIKDLSQAEQIQLRYQYVAEASNKAKNDFTKNVTSTTNQLRIFTEGIKEVALVFTDQLLALANPLIQFGNKVVKMFLDMDDSQKQMVLKIVGVAIAIGPLIMGFGKVTSALGGTITTMGKVGKMLKGGQSLLKIFGTNLVAGGIIVGLLLIIAIGVLVYKNWDKIKAKSIELWNKTKAVFKAMGGDTTALKNAVAHFKEVFVNMVEKIKVVLPLIIDALKPVGEFFVLIFEVVIKGAIGLVIGLFMGAVQIIFDFATNIIEYFANVLDFFVNIFTGNWEGAWQNIKDIFFNCFSGVYNFFTGIINAIINGINGVFGALNGIKLPDWLGGGSLDIGFTIPNIPSAEDLFPQDEKPTKETSRNADREAIPQYAKGTMNHRGGLAITQDRGGEIMSLPRGTKVYPHDDSVRMAYKDGQKNSVGGVMISKLADTIIVRNDSDIDTIVEKLVEKLSKISNNTDGGVYA